MHPKKWRWEQDWDGPSGNASPLRHPGCYDCSVDRSIPVLARICPFAGFDVLIVLFLLVAPAKLASGIPFKQI